MFAARLLSHLEQELAETKKKLTLSDEYLVESNNNIQSYNEELLSRNEELQSSNEELQSTNGELTTLNSEYHLKLKSLPSLMMIWIITLEAPIKVNCMWIKICSLGNLILLQCDKLILMKVI
ncbi:MAG: hypothetical protein M3421_13535 [Bacteroidota bacterium]|nr:hypothetical protein [Bacteroidota bacterium]